MARASPIAMMTSPIPIFALLAADAVCLLVKTPVRLLVRTLIFASAGFANARHPPVAVRPQPHVVAEQRMPSLAMCLRRTGASLCVLDMGYRFKVLRIQARAIPAQVVDDKTLRDGPFTKLVHQPVGYHHPARVIRAAPYLYLRCVPVPIKSTLPHPTAVGEAHLDLRHQALKVCSNLLDHYGVSIRVKWCT